MRTEIKKYIETELTEEYLKMEAINRFYEYFDEEDLGDKEQLDVIMEYQSEEIPLDIIDETTKHIEKEFQFDLFKIPKLNGTEEILLLIKEKIKVVYPFYDSFHDEQKEKWAEIERLKDALK